MVTRVSIEKMNLKQRSLLFARLSQIAYNDKKKVAQQIKPLGFTEVEFGSVINGGFGATRDDHRCSGGPGDAS